MEITVGHERRLKALGLTAQWYLETFERLGGKCERCGKPEAKMHYGQPKPLAVDTSMNPPRLLCQKCSQRKNKTNERRRGEAKREAEENKTAQICWEEQRRKLSEKKRAEYEAIQADVREQFELAVEHMESDCFDVTDEGRALTQEARNDFEAFVKERGQVFDLIVSAFPQFWRVDDGALLQQLLRDNNEQTRVFLQFGYYIGMPWMFTTRWKEWRQRVEWKPPTTLNPTLKSDWVALTCTTPGCGESLHALQREIAETYAIKGIKPFCYRCLDLERKSAAQATVLGNAGQERNKIFDSYGRVDHWRKNENSSTNTARKD